MSDWVMVGLFVGVYFVMPCLVGVACMRIARKDALAFAKEQQAHIDALKLRRRDNEAMLRSMSAILEAEAFMAETRREMKAAD